MKVIRRQFLAAAMLFGTIVGAGVFGLPYAASRAGILPGVFYLLGLGIIIILTHLLLAEVVLRTRQKHRLVGYAQKYLGAWAKYLESFNDIAGFYGALLAFSILGGNFLSLVFKGFFAVDIAVFWITIGFFAFSSFLLLARIRTLALLELILNFVLVAVVLTLVFRSFGFIKLANFSAFNLKDAFFPFGVVLFTLTGFAAVPEAGDILLSGRGRRAARGFNRVVIGGVALAMVISLLFMVAVLGVSGKGTTEDAISGLRAIFHDGVILLMAVFGILSIFTSFLVIGDNLKKIYWYDWKLNKYLAWFLTFSVPLALYLLRFRDFIGIVQWTGSIMVGIDGIIIIFLHRRAKKLGDRVPEYEIKIPFLLYGLIFLTFLGGVIYQVYFSFHH